MSLRSPDLTHKQPRTGGGMDTRLNFLCGCKAKREAGAVFRGWTPLRCAACNTERQAARSLAA